jgi:hypothetical protein
MAKPTRDDLPSVHVSRLRALHVITPDMRQVEIAFGEGADALRRTVNVCHLIFPARGHYSSAPAAAGACAP